MKRAGTRQGEEQGPERTCILLMCAHGYDVQKTRTEKMPAPLPVQDDVDAPSLAEALTPGAVWNADCKRTDGGGVF